MTPLTETTKSMAGRLTATQSQEPSITGGEKPTTGLLEIMNHIGSDN